MDADNEQTDQLLEEVNVDEQDEGFEEDINEDPTLSFLLEDQTHLQFSLFIQPPSLLLPHPSFLLTLPFPRLLPPPPPPLSQLHAQSSMHLEERLVSPAVEKSAGRCLMMLMSRVGRRTPADNLPSGCERWAARPALSSTSCQQGSLLH